MNGRGVQMEYLTLAIIAVCTLVVGLVGYGLSDRVNRWIGGRIHAAERRHVEQSCRRRP